jgi:hypothetical protein
MNENEEKGLRLFVVGNLSGDLVSGGMLGNHPRRVFVIASCAEEAIKIIGELGRNAAENAKIVTAVPLGSEFVIVPRRPTKRMLDGAWADALAESASGVWESMIEDAAGVWESTSQATLALEQRKIDGI